MGENNMLKTGVAKNLHASKPLQKVQPSPHMAYQAVQIETVAP
jgi:hypothetical protein